MNELALSELDEHRSGTESISMQQIYYMCIREKGYRNDLEVALRIKL